MLAHWRLPEISSLKTLKLEFFIAHALLEKSEKLNVELLEVREYLNLLKESDDLSVDQMHLVETVLAIFELRYGLKDKGEQMLARVLAVGNPSFEACYMRALLFFEDGRLELAPKTP